MSKNILEIISRYKNDPLALLNATGGFYECVKNNEGERLNRMVAYKGTYKDKDGKEMKYIGDVYHNISKTEETPLILRHFARKISRKINLRLKGVINAPNLFFVGPQEGGAVLASMIAMNFPNAKYACIERKATGEDFEMVFKYHKVPAGSFVIITKNVLNNFYTTKKIIKKLMSEYSSVVGVACVLNRSMNPKNEKVFSFNNADIPIISLVHKPYKEFKQDDPEVAGEVKKGRVEFDPEINWDRLQISHQLASSMNR